MTAMHEDAANLSFDEAVQGLIRGDFTRLEPLFLAPEGEECAIVRWHRQGLFHGQPQALAEALSCACFNGSIAAAEYLLAHGVRPGDGDGTGMNACHWAANRGQTEAVRLLIRHGAPLEALNMYGGTVLGCTVWSALNEPRPQHLEIIEALLQAGAAPRAAGYPTGDAHIDALLNRYRTGQ